MIERIVGDARAGLALTLAMIAQRPGLAALFAAALLASNLLRLWLGQVDTGSGSPVLLAAGGLFVFARLCFNQWLHVAAARLAIDQMVPVRRAFAVDTRQAIWFHGLVTVSIVAFFARLILGRATGGFFSPTAFHDVDVVVGPLVGLFVTYLLFMPFQPGWFAALQDDPRAELRWSLAGIRGQLWRAMGAVMLLAVVPATLRIMVFVFWDRGGWWALLTATLDALLTTLLMLLATAIYRQTWERAAWRGDAPAGRRG